MNRTETLAIMGVLKAAYPSYYKDMKRGDAEGIVDLWATMFMDEPVELVAMAVKSFIATDTKGFPPHIGAIKEAILKLREPKRMTEQEAWELVANAVRNGIYGADKEFKALPETVQRIVGSPNQLREWAMMDAEVVHSVVASNFQRSYKARAASEREYMALPGDVRRSMEQLAAGMSMPMLTEG